MLGQLSPNGLVLSSAGMLASAPFSGPRHSMVCCGENTEMEVDIAMKLRGAMIPQECQEKKQESNQSHPSSCDRIHVHPSVKCF